VLDIFVCYLTTLAISKLCSVGDRFVSKYGAVGGMRIGRGSRITPGNPTPIKLWVPGRMFGPKTWEETGGWRN
jgi:hypothetical protein